MKRTRTVALLLVASAVGLAGCAGPPALRSAVLGYDQTVIALEQEILLMNVARLSQDRPPHFTVTSSIAATFNFETGGSIGGSVFEGAGTDVLSLSLESRAAENPTFSIIPISGQEFTQRILNPVTEDVFSFFAFQGVRVEILGRLMADGIEMLSLVIGADGRASDATTSRFLYNKVSEPAQFREFREIILHLGALQTAGQLQVTKLTYDQLILDRVRDRPSTGDITNALSNGLNWRENPDGTYSLLRRVRGRVLVSNYDPRNLSDAERERLDRIASRNPDNFVLVDVRADGPGGEIPIFGALKLRSLFAMLDFVGKGIELFPEFAVAPRPSSGVVEERRNPRQTLAIQVREESPDSSDGWIHYQGKYYAVGGSRWDQQAFMVLYELFQVTVTDVSRIGIPITIAK